MELLSIHSRHSGGQRVSLQAVAAVVLHGAVLAALLFWVRPAALVPPYPQPMRVAAVIVPYAPGHRAVVQRPRPKIVPPPREIPKLTLKPPEPPPPPTGGDPTGEDDVSVAMADFFPDPKPDLSVLPHGTHGDVVIDIVIDETGKVVDTKVDQGLGHGLDEAVMAVLQTWTFTPATRAGKPVASKQQLLFHFERA